MAAIPQTYTLCSKVKSGLYHFVIQTTFFLNNLPPRDSCTLMLDRGQVHHGPPRRTHSIGDLSTENRKQTTELIPPIRVMVELLGNNICKQCL